MNIVLTGYRGTGKTTIGKIISKKLKMKFIDTDDEVEKKTGMKIPEIVLKQGWSKFRKYESKAVRAALKKSNAVIATGAGALVATDIKKAEVNNKAKIILLKATAKTISKRINGSLRPSLTGKDIVEEIEEVLSRRKHKYNELADMTINTTKINPEEAANSIIKKIREKK